MAPGTRKQVQEMNIDGFLLVQRKKKKVIQSHKSEIKTENCCQTRSQSKKRKVEQDQTEVTIFVHFRSISRASSITRQSLEERSMTITETRTEGQEPIKVIDTDMAKNQVEKFEEDWTRMWKPQPTFASPDPDFRN